tara:strand:- start:1926 stop:2270 length:345 start_codon:yes stop_codon:yes gene_type:complete
METDPNKIWTKPKIRIPSFEENRCSGYQVLVYSQITSRIKGKPNSQCSWAEGWVPINSCYGFPYEVKGFAINKCLNMMRQNIFGDVALFCVVELSGGRIVWQSWNEYEEQAYGK